MDSPGIYASLAIFLALSFGLYYWTRAAVTTFKGQKGSRLPAAEKVCAVCGEEPEKKVLRCSTCKGRFYCGQACQNKDWKAHKFNCSLLPSDGFERTKIEHLEELQAETTRISDLLKAWAEANAALEKEQGDQADKSAKNCATIPEALPLVGLKVSPLFNYALRPASHDKYPFRTPLVLIGRLFLMNLVGGLSSARLNSLEKNFNKTELPSHIPPVFGPKAVARPGDLSPGEYETIGFVSIIPILFDESLALDQAGKERWMALRVAHMKLWNARLA